MKRKKPNHSPVNGHYLFVYGTLKRHFFNPYAKLLKQTSTHSLQALAHGELYVFNWYPVAVFDSQSKNKVLGECHFIPKAKLPYLLAVLDDYESIGYVFPEDEYQRVEIKIIGQHNNFLALAYQHVPVKNKRYFRKPNERVKVFK